MTGATKASLVLILALIVLIVVALAVWLVDTAPIGNPTVKWAIKAVIVIIGLLVIVQRAGLG